MAKLLSSLYENSDGYLNLRAIKKGKTKSELFLIDDTKGIRSFIHENSQSDLYFGVATRDGTGSKKENIVDIPALWVDIDFKDIPEASAKEKIEALPIKPTALVRSGGGFHLYYFFKEPAKKEDIDFCERAMRGLAMRLGGDLASTDASRILRIPSTYNQKYNPARFVVLAQCNGSRYNLSDFEDFVDVPEQIDPKVNQAAQTENLVRIMNCKFMEHCRECSAYLKEPEWYAMVTILAREPGGVAMIHELSKPHKGYKAAHTDKKIMHALNDSGPMTCEMIKSRCGFTCTETCKVKSPAGLARSKSVNSASVASVADSVSSGNRGRTQQNSATTQQEISRNLTVEIKEWVSDCPGRFNVADLDRDLILRSREMKNVRARVISDLAKERVIERHGDVRGNYMVVDRDCQLINFINVENVRHDVQLPFNLSNLYMIQPKNIIMIAGDSNAGKTAFLLSSLYLTINNNKKNNKRMAINYYSSEMGAAEWNQRLGRTGFELEWWAQSFNLFYRSENFHQVIDPNALSFIDYLEIHDEFYKAGGMIKKIFDVLDKGVAIISLQKNRGNELGLGGSRALEKSRLYVTVRESNPHGNTIRIVKGKNPIGKNINRHESDFRIIDGWKLAQETSWQFRDKD